MDYKEYLKTNKDLVLMVHVRALPGTPNNSMAVKGIIDKAVEEAKKYKELGAKTVMIENMHDLPYTKQVGPEVTGIMAVIGKKIKELGLYCGIQILAGANKEALAAAKAASLDFIRAEGFVFAHVGDEGIFESCAGGLLRYRKQISAEDVLVFTDIKKKHSSHALTEDISIKETAHAAEFFLSDGIIVTGVSTGTEVNPSDLKEVQQANVPKIIGSGITADNLEDYFNLADVFIVGSSIKKGGSWENEIDEDRVRELVEKFEGLKGKG